MMNTITRKSMLYKTGVEYGDYTMNHVLGCSHSCTYPCYAYLMARRFGKVKSLDEWKEPKLVSNTLELLDKEIPRLQGKIKSVQLCFTTDPFMAGYKEVKKMSLNAIEKLNNANIQCNVLTKGILPKELINFSKKNEYGITLVSLDEKFRKKFESNSAIFEKRIKGLEYLYSQGCKTWVSIEPYPTPNIIEQDLMDILNAISFVDKIIFGMMHYSKNVSQYKNYKQFYNKEANKVISFCKKNGIEYYIKRGTLTE